MLRDLQLRNFRCFESIAVEFEPGFNFIVGPNGRGKTTLLEAACVLLRLQSQRAANLTPTVRADSNRIFRKGALIGSANPMCAAIPSPKKVCAARWLVRS